MINIKSFSIPFIILALCANIATARHFDPMQEISSNPHKNDDAQTRPRPKKESRHYNPLDAMRGKMTVKKPINRPTSIKNKKKIPKSYQKKQRLNQQKNRQKKYKADKQNTIEYKIEDIEDDATTKKSRQKPSKSRGGLDDDTLKSLGFSKPKTNNDSIGDISTTPNSINSNNKNTITVIDKNDIKSKTIGNNQKKQNSNLHHRIMTTEDVGSESPGGDAIRALMESQRSSGRTTNPKNSTSSHGRGKTLYLTFDDGPCGGTKNVLNLMREEGIKATMFYIGKNVVRSQALFRRALSMPNLLVANHTYSHANGHYRRFYNSPASSVVGDIDKAQKIIGGAKFMRLCGRNVWRLPHVKRNDHGIKSAQRAREIPKYNALAKSGYYIYGWDVEWHFSYKNQRPIFGADEMARRVNLVYNSGNLVKKGRVVVLLHDFMWRSKRSINELRNFIDIMKAQGWNFDTIDNYSSGTPGVITDNKKPLKKAQILAKKTKMLPANTPSPIKNIAKSINDQLSDAIKQQNFLQIRRLLSKGADLNTKDSIGRLPLNIAISTNNAILVKLLVEQGANILDVDDNGMSPMGVAKQHHNTIIIDYLKKQIEKRKQKQLTDTIFALQR